MLATERATLVQPVVLEGRHVRLDPLAVNHARDLLAAASGPRETYGFTTVPADEPSMVGYIEAALRDQEAGRALPFATVAKATGRVVGSTRFGNIEFWPWPPGNANAASAQRTPINTEAKLLMLTHAFETWRVHRVSFMTDARNERSRRAILRLGARFDGVLRAARPASDGGIRDTAAFSILEDEWPAVKTQLQSPLNQ
ncbi:MAG: acetyltransferase, ribosomal protein N-acetylase [Candidatus Rokubacteria bacterium]|nr:acetyltransferase, ribosomal protein N-acetylase [Candidatus Rokubacteria bacterium]